MLAKAAVIWCGEFFADATAFEKIWKEQEDLPGCPELFEAVQKTPAWPLFEYRREFQSMRSGQEVFSKIGLRSLLLSFKLSQSTVLHDKVYGLLGLRHMRLTMHSLFAPITQNPVWNF